MISHPGPELRKMIEKTGDRQAAVARGVGVTTKHLNRILQGHALPSVTLAIELSRYLDADPHEVWRLVADYQLDQALNEGGGA